VVSGKTPGRLASTEVSIFDSVGFALNDFSALRYLHRLDRELAGGSVIDLIPSLDDPKDLFGELKLGSSMAASRSPSLEGSTV
jgi:ornithine cyclodeaminase